MSETAAPTLPLIPVANLLRIAFYAGDLLEEADDCEATHDDGAWFDDLLQAMLARSAERIRLRGFERGYTTEEEITARPRGKILVSESITSCSISMRRLACRFDDFSPDTLHNRVLKATARFLVHCNASEEHADSLRALLREMRDVTDVKLARGLLAALPRSLATRRYRVVRFIARLVVEMGQPDELVGSEWARRLTQNEKRMRKVFERFVARFAKAHLPDGVEMGRRRILWSSSDQPRVGNLNTDLTIRGKDWTRIIECKYMRSATARGQYGNHMFHPTHLRQIYAYLARTRDLSQANRAIDGVILFPAIDASASQSIDLGGFPVRVIQLSLDQSWSALSKELMSVLFDR